MAIGKTRLVLYSSAIIATSNIFLDYVLIFGNWGFPAMGTGGAAVASSALCSRFGPPMHYVAAPAYSILYTILAVHYFRVC